LGIGSGLSDCTTPNADPEKIFPILSDTELKAPESAPPIDDPSPVNPEAGPTLENVFFAVVTAFVALLIIPESPLKAILNS
jgi:hypothetical protein